MHFKVPTSSQICASIAELYSHVGSQLLRIKKQQHCNQDRQCKQMVFHYGFQQQASYYRLSLQAIYVFLFRLVESATVYICFAVFCLVCPTSCCAIGVNAHLLKHPIDNILVLPLLFLCYRSVSVPRSWCSFTFLC